MPLPCPKTPFILYDSERISLRSPLMTLLHLAKARIHITTFSFDDPFLLDLLDQKQSEGLDVDLCYDQRYQRAFTNSYPKSSFLTPIKGRGLAHEKLAIIDKEYLFFSTCNWGLNSELMHRNMMIGLYSPELVAILDQELPYGKVGIGSYSLHLFRLEKEGKKAQEALISRIDSACRSITVAMFTLTHQEIVEHLIKAHQRGVHVEIIADKTCAKGASFKALKRLKQGGINPLTPNGPLLHHKWAVIDDDQLIFGSANWTKAAFHKNRDFLLLIDGLSHCDQKKLKRVIASLKGACQNSDESIASESRE